MLAEIDVLSFFLTKKSIAVIGVESWNAITISNCVPKKSAVVLERGKYISSLHQLGVSSTTNYTFLNLFTFVEPLKYYNVSGNPCIKLIIYHY